MRQAPIAWHQLGLPGVIACLTFLTPTVFAQVDELCAVPPEIGDSAQRAILSYERSGLLHEMMGVIRAGDTYEGECQGYRLGSARHQRCLELKADWDGKRKSYNAAARKFCEKVRRTSTQLEGPGSRKVEFLLDALQRHPLDWPGSIGHLRNRLRSAPEDRDLRDALDYLLGMYRGFLAAADMSNRHYQRGVRHWLDGDFRAATRSFAQAARDNPDDLRLYRTFAHAIGRQHATDECSKSENCVSGDLPRWASYFGPDHDDLMRVLDLKSIQESQPPRLHKLLNFLRGVAVYAAASEPPQNRSFSSRVHALTGQAIDRADKGDYAGAARLYAEAYLESAGDKGILFFRHYWEGVAAQAGRRDELVYQEQYLEMLADSAQRLAEEAGLTEPGWNGSLPERLRNTARAPGDRGEAYGRDDSYTKQAWRTLRAAMRKAREYTPFFPD